MKIHPENVLLISAGMALFAIKLYVADIISLKLCKVIMATGIVAFLVSCALKNEAPSPLKSRRIEDKTPQAVNSISPPPQSEVDIKIEAIACKHSWIRDHRELIISNFETLKKGSSYILFPKTTLFRNLSPIDHRKALARTQPNGSNYYLMWNQHNSSFEINTTQNPFEYSKGCFHFNELPQNLAGYTAL